MLSNQLLNDNNFQLKYNRALDRNSLPVIDLLSTFNVPVYFNMKSEKYITREEKNGITHKLVKQLFDYHKDGYLIWKTIIGKSKMNIGDRAGTLCHMPTGSRYMVGINFKTYRVSRIIFLWHNGYLAKEVDHKDRIMVNDRIQNLRAATSCENMRNRNANRNSTSKYVGVHWQKSRSKWCAQIRIHGKSKNLGLFSDEIEAAKVRDKAAKELFGEFAKINII
jgi:hypothetical protein